MDRRRVFESRRILVGLLLVLICGIGCRSALCEGENSGLSIGALKQLSIEELMNLDVTSVSKQPEPYGRAPAAIQVITQNEIRRAGASSIPEALRLAGGARYGPRHGRRNPTPLPGTVAEFAA